MWNNKSKLKIAFLTATDPNDKRSWSGTHNRMFQTLKDEFEFVDELGPINNVVLKSIGIINRLSLLLLRKRYNHNNSIFRGFLLSYFFNKKIAKKKYDIIFAPAASTEVAFLKTKGIPIVYLSDSSFGQLCGYYDVFSNLLSFSEKESNYIEQKAINNASYFVYPSKWASDFVINNYGVKKEKISIIPFGANIDENKIKYIQKEFDKNQKFNILFLGVNWERKGGPMVYQTYLSLKNKGHNISLTICGCSPTINDSNVNIIPFLNKNNKEEFNKFTELLRDTHLLFVPTKADCSPIVFCEANAFGIPVISTKTGGVGEIIINGFNGFCLDESASSSEYEGIISKIINDEKLYKNLSKNARNRYEETLNWKIWGNKMKIIFEEAKIK